MTDRKVENRKLAILFDVDDTLYDMTQPFEKAYRDVFYDKYSQLDWKPVYVASRKHSDEVFEASQRGEISMDDMYVYRWSKAMEDFGAVISREEALHFQKVYQNYQKVLSMTETIKDMLTLCCQKGIVMGVITNGPSKHQWNKTKALGLSEWIPDEAVIVSEDVGVMKPDPEIFRAAECKLKLSESGVKREDCWFVGDTFETDIKGAMAAGWRTIWFNRRAYPMSVKQPDYMVEQEEELLQVIRELIRSEKS